MGLGHGTDAGESETVAVEAAVTIGRQFDAIQATTDLGSLPISP